MKKIIASTLAMLIAVTAYLAFSILINVHSGYSPNTMQKVTRASISAIITAVMLFKDDVGRFPTEQECLGILTTNNGITKWNGPYIRTLISDAWYTPFRYRLVNDKPIVDSAGPDKKFDTEDDIRK